MPNIKDITLIDGIDGLHYYSRGHLLQVVLYANKQQASSLVNI